MNQKARHYTFYILWILVAIAIAVIIPLLIAAIYNRPFYGDDYYQPLAARVVVMNGGTFFDVLKTAFHRMIATYDSYNGVFASMFLSHMSPMIYGNQYTFIHTWVGLFMLLSSCICLCRTVGKAAGLSKTTSYCIALFMVIMMLVLLPDTFEGLYWYSSVVNYLFFFSLAIYTIAAISHIYGSSAKSVSFIHAKIALLCVLCFLIGGGNFSTSTVMVALYGLFALFILIYQRNRKNMLLLLPFIFLLSGYIIAIIAPGNANRQAIVPKSPLVDAFITSFKSVISLWKSDSTRFLWLGLGFLPIAYAASNEAKVNFKMSLLLLVLALCVSAAGYFPIIYSTQGSYPAPRFYNLQAMLKCMMYAFASIYTLGSLKKWYQRLIPKLTARLKAIQIGNRTRSILVVCYLLICFSVFAVKSCPNFQWNEGKPVFNCAIPSVKALSYIYDGSFKRYAQSYDDMVKTLEANPDGNIEIESIEGCDPLLHSFTLGYNRLYHDNVRFSIYYGVNSVQCINNPHY